MKQLEVTIVGHSYLLACPEGGEAQLRAAVAMVDAEMTAIRDAGKLKARERIAVLAALNLAYLLVQAPAQAPELPSEPSDVASHEDDVLIQQLIDRLDTTLGQDGHLL